MGIGRKRFVLLGILLFFILALAGIVRKAVPLGVFHEDEKRPVTVVIDAGHGGEDGGAQGITEMLEKDINLRVSEMLEAILCFYGVNTDMTRRDDTSLHSDASVPMRSRKVSDIKNRVKQVEETENATLISIHQNSFPQDNCKGAQVFYSKDNIYSKTLADSIQECLKQGIADGNHRVAKQADKSIYLLEHVRCPAVLVECGFMTNNREARLLVTEEYQKKLAVCITGGYFAYTKEKDGGESEK